MPSQRDDRRLRTRYKARVPFTLKNNGQEVRGITRNISLLGISAYTRDSIPQVQPVQCVLNLPEHTRSLVAHGTVIRCEPLEAPTPDGTYEVGVFFKEFQGEGEADLSRFLNHLQQQEQAAIRAGYRELKERLAARKRRRRLEALQKKRRRLARLRKRRLRLAKQKRLARLRRKKRGRPRKSS